MKDFMKAGLSEIDPQVREIVDIEGERQQRKIIMIASESLAPEAVRETLATNLGHLYAEGYPSTRMARADLERLGEYSEFLSFYRRYGSRRYYKGVEYADFIEALARRRAAELFANDRVGPDSIYVNVQSLSGAASNNAVYDAFLDPGDPVMGMDLTHGGHLTHGHEVNRSGKHYNVTHYKVGTDGKLDYSAIKKLAAEHKPRLIIAGFSAYPWDIDWEKMREVADAAGEEPAILLADIAHTAGLISAGVANSPVGYADAISMTTHKTLCGPRGAIILTTDKAKADKIDTAVFPGEQGGPHIHQIAAKAVAFKIALTPEFKAMMKDVVDNAAALAGYLKEEGLPLAYGGTDTHMVLIDLRKVKTKTGDCLGGEIASRLLDLCHITCNKNTIWGDESAFDPGAIRLGTTWVTQRGFEPRHMKKIAKIIANVLGAAGSHRYIGAFGDIVRARVEPDVLVDARAQAEALIAEVEGSGKPQPARHYPHFYTNPGPSEVGEERPASIKVYGERAHLLLDHTLSADILSMAPGERKSAYVFRPGGEVLAKTSVERLEDDDFSRRQFLLQPYEGSSVELLEWLRAVSDGYAPIDPQDPHLKPYGPACVELIDAYKRFSIEPDSKMEIDIQKPFFTGYRVILKRIEDFPDIADTKMIKTRRVKKEFTFTWTPPQGVKARETCLYEEHLKRVDKKRVAAFAGWKLPVWYSSIAEEHNAVRKTAGLFDVSHMGVLEFSGECAGNFLDMTTTAFVPALIPGQARYSYLLAPDGRVIDDIMIYRVAPQRFLVVVNAANAEEDEAWWRAAASGDYLIDQVNKEISFCGSMKIRNLKDPGCGDDRRVDLALQGRAALNVLRRTIEDRGDFLRVAELRRFEFTGARVCGAHCYVARTGYTGEQIGFEMMVHPDAAPALWNGLLEAGEPLGVVPAGLGARDSTRTEAGLPLHGHELAGEHGVNPIEAGYGSFVKIHKPFFVGRKHMVKAAVGREREIIRFIVTGKGPRMVRPGHAVVDGRKGKVAGVVTSCTMTGDREMGMAVVSRRFARPGTLLAIFAYTEKDGAPAGKKFSELEASDWLPVSKTAVVLSRFPGPVNPFTYESEE
ncbi:MAG: serine hydroxymethyltransferase [Pseudomonadota bacterium]